MQLGCKLESGKENTHFPLIIKGVTINQAKGLMAKYLILFEGENADEDELKILLLE